MNLQHPFHRLHERLREKADNARARAVTYVAFGDSVTQGCMEYDTIEHDRVYPQMLKRRLERRFPTTIVNMINSGVSGDNAHASRERWDRDLVMYRPDLVTIAFGINDSHAGPEGLQRYLQAMSDLMETVRVRTEADLLLLTPTNMMMSRDNPNIHSNDKFYMSGFLNTSKAAYLPLYANALRQFIRERELPCADIYALWEHMVSQGTDVHTRLANGLNHPDRDFHETLAAEIEKALFDGF